MSTGKWFLKMHLQKPQSAGTYGESDPGDERRKAAGSEERTAAPFHCPAA